MPSYDRGYSAVSTAAGEAVVTVRPRGSSGMLVRQVAVEVTGLTGGGKCAIRKNGWLVCPVVATGDASAGEPSIFIGATDVMTVEWTRLPAAGLECRATVFWEE